MGLNWEIILDNKLSGPLNMKKDLQIFNDCKRPTLRIYGWSPKCISLGYSQKEEDHIYPDKAKDLGWDVVKRPTGGGVVFHNEDEVTYSVICPAELLPHGLMNSYLFISEKIVDALSKMGVRSEMSALPAGRVNPKNRVHGLCFGRTENFEITANGKKLVGSAQKRNRTTMLQHGSIQVSKSCISVTEILKGPIGADISACVSDLLGRTPSFTEISSTLISSFCNPR